MRLMNQDEGLLRHLGNTWNDYEKIYPEDEYMKELDDSARVWRVSNDESERTDVEMVDGWTGTLDTLFIFAGLFSAVVSTFLTQTSQSLQQDYSAVTASLLTEMVILQRVTAIGGNISAVPQSDLTYNSTFTSSSRDVWLNSLWIASLSLTLLVALMAGLIKQWLHYYLVDITRATPKVRACTRQFRYRGLIQWGVPPIIESLPVLMNTALLLFFIGLVLFTRDLSGTIGISWFLVGLTAISFAIYVGPSFIPVWKPQCPYKTSLSKVYNGIIKVVWYFAKRLSLLVLLSLSSMTNLIFLISDDEGKCARSWFKHHFVRFKQWMMKVLRHGSSLSTAESDIVINQESMLQQDIITEMGLNSTNPSVSVIALQSLAAFQIDRDSLRLPESLLKKLGDLFHGCFQRDSSKEWNYSITSDSSIAERYSRAMLQFSDDIEYFDSCRLLSFSPPENLHTAILLANARRLMNPEYIRMREKILDIQFILDLPPIEVFRLSPWSHRQFAGAIDVAVSLDLYFPDRQEQLLVALVKRLTPNTALTLQEDVLIHYLYSSHTKAGLIEPLKEETLTKEADLEMYDDVKTSSRARLLRLIRILPDIYDCALSLGSEDQDRLFLYISGMHFGGVSGMIDVHWNEEAAYFFEDDPKLSSCVNSLAQLLNQLASSWQEWNGNVLIRLKAITELHNTLRYHGECDEEVIHAMFHWLLVLSLQGRDCPENAYTNGWSLLEFLLFDSLFPPPYLLEDIPKGQLNDSLKSICNFIILKQLLGLPSAIFRQLFRLFRHLLKKSNESTVFDCLDHLFRHFLQQDTKRVSLEYPMTRDAQRASINQLITFARKQRSRSTKWEAMLTSWRRLVDDKKAESTCIGEDIDSSAINPMEAHDWMDTLDLRDVMWIFEDKPSSWNDDPWDLRDVFWMFENDISLGAPINLKWVGRQLDKVLALQDGVEVQCGSDAAELFKGAPKDPFPLTNDQ